jgi:hypothetical protein
MVKTSLCIAAAAAEIRFGSRWRTYDGKALNCNGFTSARQFEYRTSNQYDHVWFEFVSKSWPSRFRIIEREAVVIIRPCAA